MVYCLFRARVQNKFVFVWVQENLGTNRQDPDYTNVRVTTPRCEYWPPMYICCSFEFNRWKQQEIITWNKSVCLFTFNHEKKNLSRLVSWLLIKICVSLCLFKEEYRHIWIVRSKSARLMHMQDLLSDNVTRSKF